MASQYADFQAKKLALDLTRGKPSAEQVSLSDALDGILGGSYKSEDGTDVRNYGGLDGLPAAKQLGANLLGVDASDILVGGNSSLTLMFQAVMVGYLFGYAGSQSAWNQQAKATFICPVPGYDRHFTVCEQFGINMVTVPMTATGPDMDAVEKLIQEDSSIVGMWCVPKYSNPTGVVYSDETVARIAKLGKSANANFRVFWDNAYGVHDLFDNAPVLASIKDACASAGTCDSVIQFGSTSKITFAGAGVAFMAASSSNLKAFKAVLGASSIGPDKVNQLRHTKFFPNKDALMTHMAKHAEIIKPRFASVLAHLEAAFANNDLGTWEEAAGGYFISFDTRPGLAQEVVKLAAEAGVKLTPAGATFPYGKDPEDRNIRIAPTVPTVADVDLAMQIFVCCVELASIRQALAA